jgi:hypothetical protein
VAGTSRIHTQEKIKVRGVTLAKLVLIVILAFIGVGVYCLLYPQQYQMFMTLVTPVSQMFMTWVTPATTTPTIKVHYPTPPNITNYNQICEDNFEKCRLKVKEEYKLDVELIEKASTIDGIDYLVRFNYPYPQTLKVSCIKGQLNTPPEIQCE